MSRHHPARSTSPFSATSAHPALCLRAASTAHVLAAIGFNWQAGNWVGLDAGTVRARLVERVLAEIGPFSGLAIAVRPVSLPLNLGASIVTDGPRNFPYYDPIAGKS